MLSGLHASCRAEKAGADGQALTIVPNTLGNEGSKQVLQAGYGVKRPGMGYCEWEQLSKRVSDMSSLLHLHQPDVRYGLGLFHPCAMIRRE